MATTSDTPPRRHFTQAARDAAALARQRKRDHRQNFPQDHEYVMVVVRAVETPTGFGWQIRRFGHMDPIASSPACYDTPVEAGHSGQAALARLKGASPS